jgi:hypothetical protein
MVSLGNRFSRHLPIVSAIKAHSFRPFVSLDIIESFDRLTAISNPALQTFKGGKTGASFYPGKGMRSRESFDHLTAGINPALETFKSKKTGSSFYPGKGMRDRESFSSLFSA